MLRSVMEAMELLESPKVNGAAVCEWLRSRGVASVQVERVSGSVGATDFVKAVIPGAGQPAPSLGIIGRLGGVGAFPEKLGLVSDADGAIVALACAAKLGKLAAQGYQLAGSVIVTTHICPSAPIEPHEPAPFMGSPVDVSTMNEFEVDPRAEAILSVDTTKGNWILNRGGFAITPTVKEGYVLRVSEALLAVMRDVTNDLPAVLPITTQDITPYGNGIYHVNSILQPSAATSAPVVGVATTAAVPVAGCATGANQPYGLELAARFCVEVAKAYTSGQCPFYDRDEFGRLVELYGSLTRLQTLGKVRG